MDRERIKELITSPFDKEQFKTLQETNGTNTSHLSRESRSSRIFTPSKWRQRGKMNNNCLKVRLLYWKKNLIRMCEE